MTTGAPLAPSIRDEGAQDRAAITALAQAAFGGPDEATLIDALRENKGVIDGRSLHQIVAQGVSYSAAGANIEQVPQYAPIRFAGHEAGDFFFIPRT